MKHRTQTIVIKRNTPRRSISRAKLNEQIQKDHWGRIEELPDGRVAVLQGDLGFMRVVYDVALYEPHPTFFRKDGLRLISTATVDDDQREANARFSELV